MKLKIFIVFLFFVCCILPGISLAQNKVVVIPLWSDDCDCDEIPTVTSANGRVWMDRNLGASKVAESLDDSRAYGWLYQWGRFSDGHQDRSSPTRSTLSDSDVPGHGDFITTSASPHDWRNPQNDNLWQGVDGVNNPCPQCFRLPTDAEWEIERTSWASNDAAGAFASPLKLVVAGYSNNWDGTVSNVGFDGSYYSSTVQSSFARLLYFYNDNAWLANHYRARGLSIRCIKD